MTGAVIPLHVVSPIIANGGIREIAYTNQLIANGHFTTMEEKGVSDERLIELMTDHSPFRVDVGNTGLDLKNPDHRDFLDRYTAPLIYRTRHGEDAPLPYLGLRRPKGIRENLVTAITGRFPRI